MTRKDNPLLLHSRWQDAFIRGHYADLVLTDPPYSIRTHAGQRTGSSTDAPTIGYEPLTEEDVEEAVFEWCARWDPRWFVIFTDHVAFRWWEEMLEGMNYYVFAPVIWTKPDAAPRMTGDGPTCSTEHIVVARKRQEWARTWGSLPGHYNCRVNDGSNTGFPGAKPVALMRALVRDYSRPGDVICDPFMGSGSTALACISENRKWFGCEQDAKTYKLAQDRIRAGVTVDWTTLVGTP